MSQIQNFFEQYIERGFGSMNKNDFEVLVLGEILDALNSKSIDQSLKLNKEIIKKLKINYGTI